MTVWIDEAEGKAFVKCNTCEAKSSKISNTNPVRAQRVATNFFGWRVYKEGEEWKHSCPDCVKKWKANNAHRL